MITGDAKGREIGVRLVCLAVSVGLHVGLAVAGWQGLRFASGSGEAVIVELVDRPAAAPAGPVTASAAPRANNRAPASARRAVAPAPATKVPATVQSLPAEPLCAVPETAAANTTAAAEPSPVVVAAGASTDGEGAEGALPVAGTGAGLAGEGAGGGSGLSVDNGDLGGTPGLIRATPRYESNPLPPYPRQARLNRWEGTVRLRARVTERGEIESVSLERSSGHAVLDRSALNGVQGWRFIPATRNGVPVACEVSIPVAFRLTE